MNYKITQLIKTGLRDSSLQMKIIFYSLVPVSHFLINLQVNVLGNHSLD